MASDDRHERVREAPTVALAMFLTYKKRRQARTLAEWALVLYVLEDIQIDNGGGRNRGWRWSSQQAHSASLPTIGFLPSAMVYDVQKSRAETSQLQRGQKLSQAFPHPVQVLLGAREAGKATKVVLIGCKGRGGEAVYACGAQDQYNRYVANSAKNAMWYMGWVLDEVQYTVCIV